MRAAAKKNKPSRPFDPHAQSKRTVRRARITMPDDSGKTADDLQADIDQAGPKADGGPQRRIVARKDICIAEAVFQWRGDWDKWDRENHIYTLAKALQNSGKPLDRLLVMPGGEYFYVIDGHHRLAAYDTAGWTKGIPVEVFAGSLTDARLRALAGNSKNKLPMTTQDKSAAAWRITKENLGGLTAERVAEVAGVSPRQAYNMKRVWKDLREREGADLDDLTKLTWQQAHDLWKGKPIDADDFDRESWKDQKAQQIVNLINRHNVTKALLDDPEAAALALQRLNGDLPAALIEHWASDYPEVISEMAAAIANPDWEPPF
jgi:ParB-like chromosome segregation protein Spo0J